MKLIRKFTAIQIRSNRVNNMVEPSFSFGEIEGPYYSEEHPSETFDTEEEAISYCYEKNNYSEWLIIPKISFYRFND